MDRNKPPKNSSEDEWWQSEEGVLEMLLKSGEIARIPYEAEAERLIAAAKARGYEARMTRRDADLEIIVAIVHSPDGWTRPETDDLWSLFDYDFSDDNPENKPTGQPCPACASELYSRDIDFGPHITFCSKCLYDDTSWER